MKCYTLYRFLAKSTSISNLGSTRKTRKRKMIKKYLVIFTCFLFYLAGGWWLVGATFNTVLIVFDIESRIMRFSFLLFFFVLYFSYFYVFDISMSFDSEASQEVEGR